MQLQVYVAAWDFLLPSCVLIPGRIDFFLDTIGSMMAWLNMAVMARQPGWTGKPEIGTGGAFMRLWVGKQHAVELKFIFLSPAARVFAEVLKHLCEPAFFNVGPGLRLACASLVMSVACCSGAQHVAFLCVAVLLLCRCGSEPEVLVVDYNQGNCAAIFKPMSALLRSRGPFMIFHFSSKTTARCKVYAFWLWAFFCRLALSLGKECPL